MPSAESQILSPDSDSEFRSGAEYSQLVTAESFEAQAEDIFATLRQASEAGQPRSEGYRRATETYVNDEDNEQLRLLGEVLLTAPVAAASDKRFGQLQVEIKQHGVTPERDEEERQLKHQLTTYNHGLRDLIFNNPNSIQRPTLENWLEKASGGNAVWVQKRVAGVAAEVATAKLLEHHPEVAAVQLSDVAQDLKGVDFIAHLRNNSPVNIDIKYGGNQPLGGTERRGSRIEVGIGKGAIDGFAIKPEYQSEVLHSFERTALH